MTDDAYSYTERFAPEPANDGGPHDDAPLLGEPFYKGMLDARQPSAKLFPLERWKDIAFNAQEEWLIEGILPKRGVALIYGKSGAFKSFVAMHMALHVALGRPWAGRVVEAGPSSMSERKARPDCESAGSAIRRRGETSPKMWPSRSFPPPPTLAPRDRRPRRAHRHDRRRGHQAAPHRPRYGRKGDRSRRGERRWHGGLPLEHRGACAAFRLPRSCGSSRRAWRGRAEAPERQFEPTRCAGCASPLRAPREGIGIDAHYPEAKRRRDDITLTARLSRVVVGYTKTGKEASTLIVDDVVETEADASAPSVKTIPKSLRLLMDAVREAIGDFGETYQPFANTGEVQAVAERRIRDNYFARVAEQAEPDENEDKLYDRQRNGFKRAIKAALDAKSLTAKEYKGERYLWLP